MLQELMEELGLTADTDGFTTVANRLSRLAGKEPPWSWRYARSVYKGDYPPSKKMVRAIEALGAQADGARFAGSVRVGVLVPPENQNAAAGAFVMGAPKRCARCGARFIGNVPWRKYCGTEDCKESV